MITNRTKRNKWADQAADKERGGNRKRAERVVEEDMWWKGGGWGENGKEIEEEQPEKNTLEAKFDQ